MVSLIFTFIISFAYIATPYPVISINCEENIYHKALELHLNRHKPFLMEQGYYDQNEKTLKVILIDGVTDNIPNKIGSVQIEFLSNQIINKRAKSPFYVVQVNPMKIVENKVVVYVTDLTVSKNKKRIDRTSSGASKLEFEFNCAELCFILKSQQYNGI